MGAKFIRSFYDTVTVIDTETGKATKQRVEIHEWCDPDNEFGNHDLMAVDGVDENNKVTRYNYAGSRECDC